MARTKFFCYGDETGQDTRGELFIVSVVISADQREEMRQLCEQIEGESGKRHLKWSDASPHYRLAYIKRILSKPIFRGALNFSVYQHSKDYSALTIETISRALKANSTEDYDATVFIDALPRSSIRDVGLRLRRAGVSVKKVRGVRRDENDALIRLADALCEFVRAGREGIPVISELLKEMIEKGIVRDPSQK